MRISERDYDAFAEDHFPNMSLVHKWSDCKMWSAGIEDCLLVLVEDGTKRVAVFEYDTLEERDRDIVLARRIPDDGSGPGSGNPAFIKPKPPRRPGAEALPLPDCLNRDSSD